MNEATTETTKTTVTSYDLYAARSLPYREQIKVLKDARDNGGLILTISLRSVSAADLDAELLYQADKLAGYKREATETTTENASKISKASASKVPQVEEVLATEAPVTLDYAEEALLTITASEIEKYSKNYPKHSTDWIKDVAIKDIELKAFMQLARAKFPVIPSTPFEATVRAIVLDTERPNFVPPKFIENVELLYQSLWNTNHFAVDKSYSLNGALVEARKKGDAIVIHVGVKVTERAPVFLLSQVQYYSPESTVDKWSQKPTQKTGRTSNTLFNT